MKHKDTLNYKGYIGTIEFSDEDDCLFGEVTNINAHIFYEGNNLDELYKDFKESIDDYFEMLKAEGLTPEKPYRGNINIRLQPKTHTEASIKSKKLGISLNKYIDLAVQAFNSKTN